MSLTNIQIGDWNIIGTMGLSFPGTHYFVDSVGGSDDNPGTSWTEAKKTIWGSSGGYSLLTTGKNDVLHVLGNATAYSSSAIAPWAKDFTHMVGHTAPIYTGGRVRLTNTVTTATAGEWTISGTGCVFKNIHWQWGASATATSVVGVALSGNGRNTFINCAFAGPTNATVAGGTAIRNLTITSSQDNFFYGCSFGGDTIKSASAAGALVSFNGTNNTRNVFEKCKFIAYFSNTASASINYVDGATATNGWNMFDDCLFHSASGTVVADTIRYTTSYDGTTILKACALTGGGMAVWATGAWKAVIEVINPLGAATGGLGVHPA
jgi:hypothetical protein